MEVLSAATEENHPKDLSEISRGKGDWRFSVKQ